MVVFKITREWHNGLHYAERVFILADHEWIYSCITTTRCSIIYMGEIIMDRTDILEDPNSATVLLFSTEALDD